MRNNCRDKEKFKTSEASAKAALRTQGIIDRYLNILDLKRFRTKVTEWSEYAKNKYGISERLFFEEQNGTKAIPNSIAFRKIDQIKNSKNTILSFFEKSNYTYQDVEKLFDENPGLANQIYEILGYGIIDKSEITYTDDEGKPCAGDGAMLNKFTKGGSWEIIKRFKGASHENGGIDIEIKNGIIKITGKQGEIKAKNGLVINSKNFK
jgi:hypothetical protein